MGTDTNPGLIPRIMDHIFGEQKSLEGKLIAVSIFEIYNESIYDLLSSKMEKSKSLDIGLSKTGVVCVKKIKHIIISNKNDIFKLLKMAEKNRIVSKTKMNHESSRSHLVFNIRLCSSNKIETKTSSLKGFKESKTSIYDVPFVELSIIDLAGSERAKKTEAEGKTLKDASGINLSLSILWRCVRLVKSNQDNNKDEIISWRLKKKN